MERHDSSPPSILDCCLDWQRCLVVGVAGLTARLWTGTALAWATLHQATCLSTTVLCWAPPTAIAAMRERLELGGDCMSFCSEWPHIGRQYTIVSATSHINVASSGHPPNDKNLVYCSMNCSMVYLSTNEWTQSRWYTTTMLALPECVSMVGFSHTLHTGVTCIQRYLLGSCEFFLHWGHWLPVSVDVSAL